MIADADEALHEVGSHSPHWDVMRMEALTYRMEQALQRWVVQLHDGDDLVHLTFEGTTPCVDYGPDIPRAWAWGHDEQTCRVTGELRVAGRRVAFDGWGDTVVHEVPMRLRSDGLGGFGIYELLQNP